MNTNQLQKYYDQLTPRERYAAKLAALTRADEAEITALDRAAPKRSYVVTHHYFYQEAWEHLAAVHMIQMLNMGCAFYQGQGVMFLEGKGEWEPKLERIYNLLTQLAGTILFIDTAWRNFCESEKMDPDAVLLNTPGSGVYSPDAPRAPLNHMDTLPLLLKAAQTIHPAAEFDPADIAELVETYRAAFHRLAGEQSGGWG